MFQRLWLYFKDMYPWTSVVGTLVTSAVTLNLLSRWDDSKISLWFSLRPALSLVCFGILLRVMDEFKDYEDDLILFPNRPLPSGRVTQRDLAWVWIVVVVVSFVLSLRTSEILMAWMGVMLYSHLMFKWFFLKKLIKPHIMRAFITHHPIVFLHMMYLAFWVRADNPEWPLVHVIHILPLGLLFTNWEWLRKIRSPSEETSYITYSKVLGQKLATTITLAFQMIVLVNIYLIIQKLELSLAWSLVFLPYLFEMGKVMKFFFNPEKISGLSLKKVAENQILITFIALGLMTWI